jgi:hypothetical protein
MVEMLLPIIAKTYLQSRDLARLVPARFWSPDLKAKWRRIVFLYTEQLEKDLDRWEVTKDPVLLTNIVIRHQRLAVQHLLPLTKLKNTQRDTVVIVDRRILKLKTVLSQTLFLVFDHILGECRLHPVIIGYTTLGNVFLKVSVVANFSAKKLKK